jgi:hypothetical protein
VNRELFCDCTGNNRELFSSAPLDLPKPLREKQHSLVTVLHGRADNGDQVAEAAAQKAGEVATLQPRRGAPSISKRRGVVWDDGGEDTINEPARGR